MASFGALFVSPIYFHLPEMDNGRTIHPAGSVQGMARFLSLPFNVTSTVSLRGP